ITPAIILPYLRRNIKQAGTSFCSRSITSRELKIKTITHIIMPHIELESHLPGITGLLEYRKDTGQPIRDLTQILMRGPSTLTEAERELIATIVSHGNQCRFCTTAHAAAADLLLG